MYNSFKPGELWLDNNGVHINAHGGGILLHNGVYYWYGEHKIEGVAGNAGWVGVHAYSSTDLYNWTDCGIVLPVSQEPGHPFKPGCILDRPKVLFCAKTGKFALYFHLERQRGDFTWGHSAVAVGDSPVGPFTFLDHFRPNAGYWPVNTPEHLKKPITPEEEQLLSKFTFDGGHIDNFPIDVVFRRDFDGGQMARDMTLYEDIDGSGYLIYSSEENATIQFAKLSDDFLSPSGIYSRALPGKFNEGAAVCYRKGKYYMITSGVTGFTPNQARSSVADSLLGTWTDLGDPVVGTPEQHANTFDSQSTYILPVLGKEDAFIYMGDRWSPQNAIDGRYVWLPLVFEDDKPKLYWHDEWDLSVF